MVNINGADVSVTGSVTNADRESNLTITSGSVTVGNGSSDLGVYVGGGVDIKGGTVTIKGTQTGGSIQTGNITKAAANIGGYDNFQMSGGELNLENARAWIGSWKSGETGESTFNDMVFSGGTVNLANGGLTGMSGTDADGQAVGTHLRIEGEAVVNANSGKNNVINAMEVSLSGEAAINVNSGTKLQISTFNKEGLEWANPYDQGPVGKFTMNGGSITNNGVLTIRNDFVVNDGTVTVGGTGSVETYDVAINGGKIVIRGAEGATGNDNGHGRTLPAFGAYTSFVMNDGEMTLANGGRIWIGSPSQFDPDSYGRMELKGGKITLDGHGWITGTKQLISNDNSDGEYEGEDVLAYNTIGFDGAQIVVNGEGNTLDAVRTELTAGSLTINGELNVRATVSTNQDAAHEQAAEWAIEDHAAFVVSGGNLTIEENGSLNFSNTFENFEIVGGTVTNMGLISAEKADNMAQTDLTITIGQNGTLNTSIFQDNFKVNKVVVEKGGVFNIAALNSKISDESEENDRLLIGYGNEWTLAGGSLQVAGKDFDGVLKIGTANNAPENKGTGVLNVTAGDYHFGKVEFGSAEGNALNISGGIVAVDTLDTTYGEVNVSKTGTLQTSSDQVFEVTEGQLFADTEEQAADASGVSLNNGLNFTEGGSLALTDNGYYTSASLAEMSAALKAEPNEGQLVILNAQLAAGENGQIVDGFVQATVDADVAGDVSTEGVVTITPTNAGVQSVTVTSENAGTLAIGSGSGNSSSFTLTGSAEGGQLVKNEAGEALAVSVESGSTLTLGSNAIESETKGSLESLTVSGTAEVVNMAANVETLSLTEGGKFTVGNASDRGSVDVENLEMVAGSSIFLDPAVFGTVADASHFGVLSVGNIAGEIVAGQNSVVSLGATSAEGAEVVTNVLNRNGLTWGENGITAAVYVGSAVTIADTGYVVADGSLTSENFTSASAADYSPGTLSVGGNALLAANQAAVSGDEVLVTGTVAFREGSTLAIVNATEGQFNLATTVTDAVNATVITDNPFYAAQLEGSKVVTSQDTANGVASIASAGIQAMTRRADFMLSQTVADRASVDQEMQPGVNLWVDVAGENYQMDGMDYGAEFEADTFYGSFGGDIKLGDAYTVGAAFQYGDGSLRSSVNGVKNDVTNYGLALYGTAKFGDAKVVGELSYIWGENDITAAQSALNQSVDTAVYSAGVTGMYELRAGGFSFVPSIGLRISQLETDAMRVGDVAIADQDQTLVQIPVALRINGADMTAGGWKLAPSFKIAYVPTFGDTEINVRNIETDVIDTSPVQMDFGLRAGTDNLLINAAFSLGAGKEGSSSIGGKVGLKYAF